MASLSSAAADLRKVFAGELLDPGAATYDAGRRVHNGAIDTRPALIARCRGTADIADAIRIASGHHLPLSVRGGGHNVAGRATVDGGLMLGGGFGWLMPRFGMALDNLRSSRSFSRTAWARESDRSLRSFASPPRYGNYLSDDDLNDANSLTSVYGPNLPRLRRIKKEADPGNLFRLNLNIPPAD